jgi:hypothetical protein
LAQLDFVLDFKLSEQQPRNEKAANYEKQKYAVPARNLRDCEMRKHDCGDA